MCRYGTIVNGAVFDANRPAALEQDPRRMCLGRDGQVGTALGGAEIGARRTPAPAVGGRRLVIAHAFLRAPLKSSLAGTPASIAACTIASPSAQRTGLETCSGPPTP